MARWTVEPQLFTVSCGDHSFPIRGRSAANSATAECETSSWDRAVLQTMMSQACREQLQHAHMRTATAILTKRVLDKVLQLLCVAIEPPIAAARGCELLI